MGWLGSCSAPACEPVCPTTHCAGAKPPPNSLHVSCIPSIHPSIKANNQHKRRAQTVQHSTAEPSSEPTAHTFAYESSIMHRAIQFGVLRIELPTALQRLMADGAHKAVAVEVTAHRARHFALDEQATRRALHCKQLLVVRPAINAVARVVVKKLCDHHPPPTTHHHQQHMLTSTQLTTCHAKRSAALGCYLASFERRFAVRTHQTRRMEHVRQSRHFDVRAGDHFAAPIAVHRKQLLIVLQTIHVVVFQTKLGVMQLHTTPHKVCENAAIERESRAVECNAMQSKGR
jgi:hypothetical protein